MLILMPSESNNRNKSNNNYRELGWSCISINVNRKLPGVDVSGM